MRVVFSQVIRHDDAEADPPVRYETVTLYEAELDLLPQTADTVRFGEQGYGTVLGRTWWLADGDPRLVVHVDLQMPDERLAIGRPDDGSGSPAR